MACIAHDGRHTRVAGRGGMGAVMGSKNLKAIVIPKVGDALPAFADPKGLEETLKLDVARMRKALEMFAKYGTPGSFSNNERLGNLPINNWRDARAIDLAGKINGIVMAETIQVKRAGCKRCPIICSRVVQVNDGPYATNGIVEGPEYENLGALGSVQLVDNLAAVTKANESCNRYGLDTISTGGTIGFANECFEKGVLTKADTDGLELGMSHPDSNIELIRRIAFREKGIGELLCHGSRHAAKEIGKGAEEYAIEVKGLELPMHDPRFSWGHGVSYATGNRGGCHLTSLSHAYELVVTFPEVGQMEPAKGREREGKAQFVVNLQNYMNLRDSLVFCNFDQLNNAAKGTHVLGWYNLITGRNLAFEDFMTLGERGFQLKRMISNRRGVTRKDDNLPPRLRTLKKVGQDLNFEVPPLYPMLSEYYDLRGWTEEGRPSPETVGRLGLKEFVTA
jgi:aldehyde:ferredoxin oxidoreductase